MNTQRAAEVQAVLEGIALPATKRDLIAYARAQDPSIVRDLEGLPDEEFDRLDAVGDWLLGMSAAPKPKPGVPHAESGLPPGGDDYVNAFPDDTGWVRHDAPKDNPPHKAIEKASKLLKKQAAKQED